MTITGSGRRMLITGASSGLGKASAEYFKNKGYEVVAVMGRKECDFTDMNAVDKFAYSLAADYDFIDVIVHCAGGGFGYRENFPVWERLETLYRVNVVAPAIINSFLVPAMKSKRRGNVIHIASIAARHATASVGYSTVKAGVLAYVRTLGRKLATYGVIVTGIIPGSFVAEGNNWDRYIKDEAPFLDKYIEETCPRGRLGKVEELLPVIEFLASEKATMMCGCCVPADGGEGVTYP